MGQFWKNYEKSSSPKEVSNGVIARQGGNLALVFEKSGIFSGAASEGYGSNPTRQPFFQSLRSV